MVDIDADPDGRAWVGIVLELDAPQIDAFSVLSGYRCLCWVEVDPSGETEIPCDMAVGTPYRVFAYVSGQRGEPDGDLSAGVRVFSLAPTETNGVATEVARLATKTGVR